MAQQRRHSVYDSLQCGIGSTIPKRTVIKDSWVRKSFHCGEPINFTEGSLSDSVTPTETIPDNGYVKRKTLYFESQPLAISQPLNKEKARPQEKESKIIKYRVKRPFYGYPKPNSLRRTMTIVGDFSRCEFEFVDAEIPKEEENGTKRGIKRNPIVRRHTTHVSPRPPIVAQMTKETPVAPNTEKKSPQKRVLDSYDSGRRSREVPDTAFIPDSSGSDAVVDGCGGISLRGPSFHADSNTASACYKPAYDAGIMNGLYEETASVPRVIGAAIKSYKDIPEELFNSLPESSVDPKPDGGLKDEANSEWTNMLEGRRALLWSEGSDPETERNLKRDPQRIPIRNMNSTKTSCRREELSNENLMEQPNHTNSGIKSCPKHRSPSSRNEGDVVSKEYLRQLERDLQQAGVFFRFPSPPPPFDEEGAKGEVSVALATLDASLDGFSCSSDESSGESGPQAAPWVGRHPHASSVIEVRQSTVESSDGTSAVDASRAISDRPSAASSHLQRELLSRASASSITMRSKSDNYRPPQVAPNAVNKTIIRVGGSATEGTGEKTNGRAMENLNLIEEVYVRSRTKELMPESSVQMKAYYPSVDFGPRTSSQPVQIVIDSDSGHESGATSPCGTLTGEETSSPPPSPSVQKENSSANTIDHNSDNNSLLSSKNSQKLSNGSDVTLRPEESSEESPNTNPINPPQISPDLGTVVVSQTQQEDDKEMTVEETSPPHFVVIAIDFGTTYSGYAFSFTRDPDNVHMMKKWEGGDPGIQNQKTPTIVLLNPEEEFHSLGFGARDTFHDLEPKEAQKWLYFDRFKMELHSNQSLTRDTLLVAKNGKTVPALKIFAFALRYFRDHAIRELSEQTGIQVEEEDIRWVITVPAIWSLPAKQFMRTAAYQAGMAGPTKQEKLLIALEPEAAAIYCRKLRQNQLLQDKSEARLKRILSTPMSTPASSLRGTRTLSGPDQVLTPELDRDFIPLTYKNCERVADWLCEGTVYMVVDCGGGTVDITVHQMTDRKSGHLKELHKATGGPFGSIGVDHEFEELLNVIFGEEFMTLFKMQRSAAYVDLMIAFESRKRNASPYKSSPLNIALPFSFIDLYKKTNKKEVENAIRRHQHLGIKWSSQGMLRIEPETMKRLFQPTLEKISEAIRSVLLSPEVGLIQYMFLVGGFAESELLQKHIRDSFGDEVNVIIPQGMGLAILRGAVQFGLDPSVVTVRRSRLTYGVGVLNRFEEGIHPPEKKVVAANSEWCADILDKFVVVDESIAIGDVVTRSYTPATQTQKSVILHLYATPESNVTYVTDPSVQRVGTLHLQLGEPMSKSLSRGTVPPSYPSPPKEFVDSDQENKRREITVHLKFGGTEVKASAVDHFTGQCVKAVIEFLAL